MGGELEKAELIQEIAQMSMRGKTQADIAREKGISTVTVRAYIDQWQGYVKDKATSDPELLDRFLENSLQFIENFDLLIKNAWEVHEEAKEAGVVTARLQAIKVIQELTAQKARLYQLLGPRVDTNYLEKAKRAERVNDILSHIIQDTVRDCDVCMPLVWERLQEAFSLMNAGARGLTP